MPPMKMAGVETAADEITAKLGDISDVHLYFNSILVVTYLRPEKTQSGIFLTDNTRKEDEWQGKAGLVVKIGPTAFKDDGQALFHGQNVSVGDWIVYRPSDGWDVTVNGTRCRILQDINVKLRIPAPDVVW